MASYEQQLKAAPGYDRAKSFANDLVSHLYTEDGTMLAHVEECEGFREVWDYHGGHTQRQRLERRREEVAARYDIQKQLFQKVYYARNLTAEDEMKLRTIWSASNASHDNSSWLLKSFFAAAYVPAIWRVTRQVSPANALAFTGVYYGVHWFV